MACFGQFKATFMTDQQREQSISDMGLLMTSAYARYELTHCFSDKGRSDSYRIAMERLIGQRSLAQIEQMELDRGLV